jgi:hypothetical protein
MSKIYRLLLPIDWLIGIATLDPDERQNILTTSQAQQLFKCRRLLLRNVVDTATEAIVSSMAAINTQTFMYVSEH